MNGSHASPGRLVIVSGPSGVGKNTVVERLLADPGVPLVESVSATTRPPRPGEKDGVDYHFISPEEFERHRLAGDFLECFQVFEKGDWYGTLRSEVSPRLAAGCWVLLQIDVQGARRVSRERPDAITIFLRPPSMNDLEKRLRGRNTETEKHIEQRLRRARLEMEAVGEYHHQVVNDDVERAAREIREILIESEKNQDA